ncbi:UNVERIFIED_CONTAM: hypothetical protein Sangu_2493000 [Sesamum angustifolium]|uniref:Uncharacterized protein n=1 Tax=Sesamum angustifolium TaxID=2727405 RepID=A0AAW2KFP6_9LAMI
MDHVGAVERPMMDYSFPTADGTISSIAKPTIEANNFEIKPSIVQIIHQVCNFLVYLKRTLISILLIFLYSRLPICLEFWLIFKVILIRTQSC